MKDGTANPCWSLTRLSVSARRCGSVADTSTVPVAPAATEALLTAAIWGGRLSGSTVIGTVMVLVSGLPVPSPLSVARKLTEKGPVWPNTGVQRNSSVPASKVAPAGSGPTGTTVTVAGKSLSSIRLPAASRCGG